MHACTLTIMCTPLAVFEIKVLYLCISELSILKNWFREILTGIAHHTHEEPNTPHELVSANRVWSIGMVTHH